MQLLNKTVTDKTDKKKDNADKTALFAKEHHPQLATSHMKEWAFIADESLRENIAYQMQYLEFMIALYNNYQVYLTIESLLCKDILATIGGVVEAALFDMLQTARLKGGLSASTRTDFTALLGEAYHSFKLIDRDTWHYFHELRKVRNFVHLTAADFQEHTAYTIEETNEAITQLEKFRKSFA